MSELHSKKNDTKTLQQVREDLDKVLRRHDSDDEDIYCHHEPIFQSHEYDSDDDSNDDDSNYTDKRRFQRESELMESFYHGRCITFQDHLQIEYLEEPYFNISLTHKNRHKESWNIEKLKVYDLGIQSTLKSDKMIGLQIGGKDKPNSKKRFYISASQYDELKTTFLGQFEYTEQLETWLPKRDMNIPKTRWPVSALTEDEQHEFHRIHRINPTATPLRYLVDYRSGQNNLKTLTNRSRV